MAGQSEVWRSERKVQYSRPLDFNFVTKGVDIRLQTVPVSRKVSGFVTGFPHRLLNITLVT